jgi:hypothetical protein
MCIKWSSSAQGARGTDGVLDGYLNDLDESTNYMGRELGGVIGVIWRLKGLSDCAAYLLPFSFLWWSESKFYLRGPAAGPGECIYMMAWYCRSGAGQDFLLRYVMGR